MRILGLEIRKARPRGELAIKQMRKEPRTRSATKKFTYGNVQANIYSPFDDEKGETQWRFSLVKLCGRKANGEQVYRKSFQAKDEDDLHFALPRRIIVRNVEDPVHRRQERLYLFDDFMHRHRIVTGQLDRNVHARRTALNLTELKALHFG